MIVLIHGPDDVSNYTVFLSFQLAVSYIHNGIYIYRIDLMQNHNSQIVLGRARGEEVKAMRVVCCHWPRSRVIGPPPSFQPGQFLLKFMFLL